jgi:hypothetical protein
MAKARTARRSRTRKSKPRGMMGRPPTGLRPGERLTDYKRITVRLPPRTVSRLEALAGQLEITQWRVMVQALDAYAEAQAEMTARRSRIG